LDWQGILAHVLSLLCWGFIEFLHVCGAIIFVRQKFAFLHLLLEAKSLQMQPDAKIFELLSLGVGIHVFFCPSMGIHVFFSPGVGTFSHGVGDHFSFSSGVDDNAPVLVCS
jgi:hypothetical protein